MGSSKEFDQEDCPNCGYTKYYDKVCPHCGYTPTSREVAFGTWFRLVGALCVLALMIHIFYPVTDFFRSLANGGNIRVIGSIEIYSGTSVSVLEESKLLKIVDKKTFDQPFRWNEDKLRDSYSKAMNECLSSLTPALNELGRAEGVLARNMGHQASRIHSDVVSVELNSYIWPQLDPSIVLFCRKEGYVPKFLEKRL